MFKELWAGRNLTNPKVQTIHGGYALKMKEEQFTHYPYNKILFLKLKGCGLSLQINKKLARAQPSIR